METQTDKRIPRFFAVTTALACAVALLVATVNYTVDPASLFHPGRDIQAAQQAVDILLSGQNVAHMDNFNERLVKRYMIYEMPAAHTIVLGSSRGALISSDMASGESFLNLSVTAASAHDLVGIYGLLDQEGKTPSRVIFSLDLWWLNDSYRFYQFENAFADTYNWYTTQKLGYDTPLDAEPDEQYTDANHAGLPPLAPWQAGADAAAELFSGGYFQSSLQSLFSGTREPEPTMAYLGETGILRADGSYGYPQAFRDGDAATITHLANTWLPNNVLGSEDVANSGDEAKTLFYRFIKQLVADGVQVQFVLAPLNPIVYDHMEANARYARALEAESWYLGVAEEFGIVTVGSFDPDKVGAVLTDFYDAPHYKLEGVAELMRQLEEKMAQEENL